MTLTRKEFLKTSSLIAGGFFLPLSNNFGRMFQQSAGNFKTIRDNVGIYTEKGGTIGWYVSDDAVVVIDSQYADTAKHMFEGLQKKTSRKIDMLFNTHHHGDHTSGNVFLKDHAERIIAQENCKALQEKSYGGDPAKPQAYPTATFKKEWNQVIGKETVSAKFFGAAHTGGDSVVHFQNANIAHMGDLVFNRTYPYIDSNGGGSVEAWPIVLERIINYYHKDTIFIFGHGASDELVTGSMADLTAMKNYLSALIEFVSAEIKAGKSKELIASAGEIPGFGDLKERWAGARKMNLEKTYDELSAK
ncbi:MAG: MBL fold metallo-hydrolase [Ignavibacteriae bacterium HGW-Ignavibacteriae-3]|nr:MAG: MBL fold metallo-hydrolase [Ignavibacteriae bacterium HGW-Ignavibacteriae-3]